MPENLRLGQSPQYVRPSSFGGYFQGGAQWSDVVVFSILIGTLVLRPTGLLGTRTQEK